MDASRSTTIYTRDDTSAQQFFYYVNIYVRLHVSNIQVVITDLRFIMYITESTREPPSPLGCYYRCNVQNPMIRSTRRS